jgi:hypothetical protein
VGDVDVDLIGPTGDVRRVHFAKQNGMMTYGVQKLEQ